MRTRTRLALIPAALAMLACQDRQVSDGLKEDLALIASSQIELAPGGGSGASVVSAVENVLTPAAAITPTPTRKRAPKVPPPLEIQADAGGGEPVATALEVVSVAPSDHPVAVEAPAPESAPAVRPRPIEPRFPVGDGAVFGAGRDRGTGDGPHRGPDGGGIGVVIRGGRTGDDPCAIHHPRGGRPGVGILINERVPTRPTFPRY